MYKGSQKDFEQQYENGKKWALRKIHSENPFSEYRQKESAVKLNSTAYSKIALHNTSGKYSDKGKVAFYQGVVSGSEKFLSDLRNKR